MNIRHNPNAAALSTGMVADHLKLFPRIIFQCIQLIFYRPKKKGATGDILVKAMLNEREATLPVPTTQHPYYRWEDLRAYWSGRLDRFDAMNQAAENKK